MNELNAKKYRVLAILGIAELLGMSLWFAASAISPELQDLWALPDASVAWLTTIVQFGFVVGTAAAALLNLADIFPSRLYFAASALLAGAANLGLLWVGGFEGALVLRFATGFFLAGVYPPAMKMIATWFRSSRGFAIGTVVGALTVGKALPYLLKSFQATAPIEGVVAGTSIAAAVSAFLVFFFYRDGPHTFKRSAFSWRLVARVLRHRETRLATAGYLGHMWELYPMWTLVGLFFLDIFPAGSASAASLAAFSVIAVGGAGAVLAGIWADRIGRERMTILAMAVSGGCALVTGFLTSAPMALVVVVGLVWGFFVVADSAQFSAVVTEVAPPDAVGTALSLQTSLGFLLTGFTIWMAFELQAWAGWPVAFGALAVGPVFGILSMWRLRGVRG